MRVGFIGAGGTGKTSLAEALAAKTGWPLHRSINRQVFAQFNQTQLTHTSLPPSQRWAIQRTSFLLKIQQDQANPHGIFERTLLDHYMYCLLYCHEAIPDREISDMQELVQENIAGYTRLYYFPIYNWPVSLADEFRDTGVANRELQDVILQGLIYSLLHPILLSSVGRQRFQVIPNLPLAQRLGFVMQDWPSAERLV
jgi:predicted ATPase